MPMDGPLILIVEDNGALLWALARLFRRRGWRVLVAGTVAAALDWLAERPDWIMLDLALPDGDGEEVLSAAHTRCPDASVVIATAQCGPNRLARLASLRPDAVLFKPIEWDAVCRLCELPVAESH